MTTAGALIPPSDLIELGNYISGNWERGSGAALDVISPYFGRPVGRIWLSDAADVERAVASTLAAQKSWGATPIKERTQVMFRVRELLLQRMDALCERICLENGKTLPEAKAEILKGIEVLEYAISIQNLDEGGKMEVSRGVWCEYRREPLGVVVGVTPFNFPAMVPMWMLPIALTLGNGFVWKPSDKTPLTSQLLAQVFSDAGLPAGVLTIVQGGVQTVEALLDHPAVQALGFVGSTPAARAVYRRGCNNLKRVLALGGAKNHIFLLPDADPELAALGIADSFTGCAGQRCMAASVVLAVGDVSEILRNVAARAQSLKLGSEMGALISRSQVQFLEKAREDAQLAGAKLLAGGQANPPSVFEGGHWFRPTVLDGVKPHDIAAREELFGPMLSVIHCENLSEAMEIENANPFGNAASVFTRDGGLAERVATSARAAMIGINIGIPVPREPFSFGGMNDSKFGHGDITGKHSLNFWSHLKKVTTKWRLQEDHNWMS